MEGITVDQLAQTCLKLSAQGKGNKCVVMTSDDEGNEYHQAWAGLFDGKLLKPYVDGYQMCHCISQDISDYVVLR